MSYPAWAEVLVNMDCCPPHLLEKLYSYDVYRDEDSSYKTALNLIGQIKKFDSDVTI